MDKKIEQKIVAKHIRFTEKMAEMVQEMMDEQGYISFSAVVHQGVINLYKSHFPAYIQAKDTSPVGKAKRKQQEIEAKKAIREEEMEGICQELGGEIVEKNGVNYCNYFTYQHKKRYEQSVPVEQLSDGLAQNQYSPSKAKVLQLQKDKKVDY